MEKITRVFIVDDSAVVRKVMTEILEKDLAIKVIGSAADPLFAVKKMERNWPDVIVLDVEMPRMDGITYLKKIMSERPTPVVICSSLTEKGATITMQALSSGAVAVVEKPKGQVKDFLEDAALNLTYVVKTAAKANVANLRSTSQAAHATPAKEKTSIALPPTPHAMRTTERIVAIGTSTGGTQALETVLTKLPVNAPGIVIVQHMPEKFTAMFAERLNSLCNIRVKEAKNNDRVLPGTALIAPGGQHMELAKNGAQYCVKVFSGPLVNRHRPSVDVLFKSVAKNAGKNALGMILTGMGDDGAVGLKEMHDIGSPTVAQNEKSCVVFGMPKEAINLGAADHVQPLSSMAATIKNFASTHNF